MKMKIEVWSDIMCPYCYIGKLHYEKALEQFEYKDQIELEWKAFQLNPDLPDKGNGIPVMDYLHNTVGVSEDDTKKMNEQIAELAKENGVKSNLENAFAANTLDAHRLIKLAATKGLDSKVMQLISKAYFEEAKDYSDHTFLTEIGTTAGLEKKEVEKLLGNDDYAYEVKQDIQEANNLGFDTVPTFLFNRKHALVGSQPVGAFIKTLQKAFLKWQKQDAVQNEDDVDVTKGKSCSVDGTCDI
ncbi:MAG TPA: DsbA family oxidoreductase [Dysgonamonadaceae bacterium]|nr:DsbA family oxidoreductase [Dysgonamonadaceae bacterium]